MSIKILVREAINKDALKFAETLKEELRKRVGLAIKTVSANRDLSRINEGEYEIGADVHQTNHASLAQMHRELAAKHRKMGGSFNARAASAHDDAAKAQEDAANHVYSFERTSDVHTSTHEPAMKAARAAIDKASVQTKAAFSASHLADAEDKD